MNARPSAELVARALLVGLMLGALVAAIVAIGQQLIPGWDGRFLIVWCVIAGAVAQWTDWLLRERLPLNFNRLWFRVGEIGLLIVLFHLGDTLIGGGRGGMALTIAIDMRLALTTVPVLLAWGASAATAGEFDRLGEIPGNDQNYVAPLETLTGRLFGGGLVLLIAVAAGQVAPRQFLSLRQGSVTGPILTLLIYFGCGMVLLTLAQHTLNRRRWAEEGLSVAAGIGGRWTRYGAALIGIAALLAFALPTGWGALVIDLLALALRGIIALLLLLGIGFISPFAWLLALLGGGSTTDAPANAPAIPPPPPLAPPPDTADGSPLELLRWLLLAALVLALVVWFARGWLENGGDLRQAFGRFGPLRLLRTLLGAFLARLRGLAATVSAQLPGVLGGWRRAAANATRPRLPLRRAHTPRDQIVRYYLSVIERADAQGYPRRPAQTPEEYAPTLAPHLAEADTDWTALTAEFVEARYSAHDLAPDDSSRARSHWQRVRDALRLKRRSAPGEQGDTPGD